MAINCFGRPKLGLVYDDRMDIRQNSLYLARTKDIAMTVAGLTMVLTPLALWASPNVTAFYTVLLTCAAAYGLYLALNQIGPEDTADGLCGERRVQLPPQLITRLQGKRELDREELPELRLFVQDYVRQEKPDGR